MSIRKKSRQETSGYQLNEFSSIAKIHPPTAIIGEYHEKDELYDPFDHRDKKNATSDVGALTHLVKSSLGSGILAMPNAIRNGGLIFGGIGTIILGIICAHCVHMLVKSSHVLCRRTKTPMMTFAETAEAAITSGPKSLRRFAIPMRKFVNFALSATYIGGACVYLVFIGESMKQVFAHHTGLDVDIRYYILSLAPAVALLSQLRNLKHLQPFSMVANFCVITGLGLTMYFVLSDLKPISSVRKIGDTKQLPFFFATVIFAIEGIGTVMPVANSMKKPQHFLGCPSILNITMTIIVTLYGVIGVFGYLCFGDETKSFITLNLPVENILAQAVKLLMALAVLLTYGLLFYVPMEIMCGTVRPMLSHRYIVIGETLLRCFMSLLTVALAIAVPNLEPFIGLVGAIFFSILGICIPAIIETLSCWEAHLGRFNWRLWKNSCLVFFALFALVTGTFASVESIIAMYSHKEI